MAKDTGSKKGIKPQDENGLLSKVQNFNGSIAEYQVLWKELCDNLDKNKSISYEFDFLMAAKTALSKIKNEKTGKENKENKILLLKTITKTTREAIKNMFDKSKSFKEFLEAWSIAKPIMLEDKYENFFKEKVAVIVKNFRKNEGDTPEMISLLEDLERFCMKNKYPINTIITLDYKKALKGYKYNLDSIFNPLPNEIIDKVLSTRIANNNKDIYAWLYYLFTTKDKEILNQDADYLSERKNIIEKYKNEISSKDILSSGFVKHIFEVRTFDELKQITSDVSSLTLKYEILREEKEQLNAELGEKEKELRQKQISIFEFEVANQDIKKALNLEKEKTLKMKKSLDELEKDANLIISGNKNLLEENITLQETLTQEQEKSNNIESDLNIANARIVDLERKQGKDSGVKVLAKFISSTYRNLNNLALFSVQYKDSENDDNSMFADVITEFFLNLEKAGVKQIGLPYEKTFYDSLKHDYKGVGKITNGDAVQIIDSGWLISETNEVIQKASTKKVEE